MKLVLGVEVGLRPGDFVLDGDPAPLPKTGMESPKFYCRYWYIQVQVLLLYAFYF